MLGIHTATALRTPLYLLTLGCSLALPFLVQHASESKARLEAQRHLLAIAQQQSRQNQFSGSRLAQWQHTSKQWHDLSEQALTHGVSSDLWDSRSIHVDGKRLSRQEVDTLLTSLATQQNAFMLPTSFSLKLLTEEGSVLVASADHDQAGSVYLSLAGTYYSRRLP